jgi:hypothetical protein
MLLSYEYRGTGFLRICELKARDNKRFIVFTETRKDRRAVVEIAYEINGDKLKLSCPEKLPVLGLAEPFDVSGEWQRQPIDKE